MILLVYSPLLSFHPSLSRVKREGLLAYGRLGSRYVEAFEEKWIRGAAPNDEELLGSSDIQSLADLGNSFAVVQEMRVVPFSLRDLIRLAAITAAPLLPLTLTVFPSEELVTRVVKIFSNEGFSVVIILIFYVPFTRGPDPSRPKAAAICPVTLYQ
jgi:hypothetical protein